ncbi:hypothetical protein B0H12DRAFT_1256351 [Mycena haematopus]|nr:hypothetical protein B0H12DRAFT_1256351 [Mycena haematopus]
MPRREFGGCCWCCFLFLIIVIAKPTALPTLVAMVRETKIAIEESAATQRTLLSRITNNTPISGFYGPGAWWSWLITVGMTQGLRRAGTAMVPLLLALTASFFALSAHDAISLTVPVIWCRFHNGVEMGKREIPFTAIDYPAGLLGGAIHIPHWLYISRDYWLSIGGLSGVVVVVAPMVNLLRRRSMLRVLLSARYGLAVFGFLAALPLLLMVALRLFSGESCGCPCDALFPAYWNILLEMDQLAALLGVTFIAGFRSFYRILNAVYPHRSRSLHEHIPLLPVVHDDVPPGQGQ